MWIGRVARGDVIDQMRPALQVDVVASTKEALIRLGDVAEITEPYAFQELLWCEQLGLCKTGEGGKLMDSGATRIDGDIPVNPSGGVLAMNPYVSRGLYRLAEVALQIKGQAGERQIDNVVKTGLAHGTHGFAGQFHAVAILGG